MVSNCEGSREVSYQQEKAAHWKTNTMKQAAFPYAGSSVASFLAVRMARMAKQMLRIGVDITWFVSFAVLVYGVKYAGLKGSTYIA